jgi:hypothetical protein
MNVVTKWWFEALCQPHERCSRREVNNEFQINRSCGAVIRKLACHEIPPAAKYSSRSLTRRARRENARGRTSSGTVAAFGVCLLVSRSKLRDLIGHERPQLRGAWGVARGA